MCRVCDVLAPHLLERFPPSDYPHLYLTHYSSLVDLRAREVDEKAVVYLSDYTEHAESAPGQKWCRAVKLQFMGHASLALQLNEGYGEGYFVPRLTRGDGNCLLHAVSRAIWGIELYHRFLRQRLITELENNRDWCVGEPVWGSNRARSGLHGLMAHSGAPRLPRPLPGTARRRYIALLDMSHPGVGEAEFTRALARARTDHAELTLLHVVALAHALHRPILLMASSEHMASHGSGYNGVRAASPPRPPSATLTRACSPRAGLWHIHALPLAAAAVLAGGASRTPRPQRRAEAAVGGPPRRSRRGHALVLPPASSAPGERHL